MSSSNATGGSEGRRPPRVLARRGACEHPRDPGVPEFRMARRFPCGSAHPRAPVRNRLRALRGWRRAVRIPRRSPGAGSASPPVRRGHRRIDGRGRCEPFDSRAGGVPRGLGLLLGDLSSHGPRRHLAACGRARPRDGLARDGREPGDRRRARLRWCRAVDRLVLAPRGRCADPPRGRGGVAPPDRAPSPRPGGGSGFCRLPSGPVHGAVHSGPARLHVRRFRLSLGRACSSSRSRVEPWDRSPRDGSRTVLGPSEPCSR